MHGDVKRNERYGGLTQVSPPYRVRQDIIIKMHYDVELNERDG